MSNPIVLPDYSLPQRAVPIVHPAELDPMEKVRLRDEIKALLKDPQQKRVVNEEALFHYLSFLTTPAPLTLFEGINKLP